MERDSFQSKSSSVEYLPPAPPEEKLMKFCFYWLSLAVSLLLLFLSDTSVEKHSTPTFTLNLESKEDIDLAGSFMITNNQIV